MRTENIGAGWRVSGRLPGAGHAESGREVQLPFELRHLEPFCGNEGAYLRIWTLSRLVDAPMEPPHSHAERILLTLEGVYGQGELLVEGCDPQPLLPGMEVDLSCALRGGACYVQLRFDPHFPVLLPGEYGSAPPVDTALFAARVRSVYLLRIVDVNTESGDVQLRLFAYGAGKVSVRLQLMREDALLWSERFTVHVCVGEQTLLRKVPNAREFCGAQLLVHIDMGGEGCDQCTVPFAPHSEDCRAVAHFYAIPTDAMLQSVRHAGFDAVALRSYAHQGVRAACAREGLDLYPFDPNLPVRTLLRPDHSSQPMEQDMRLLASIHDESPLQQFLQAQHLEEAVLCARAAGRRVHVQALGRQADAQFGLFDAQGRPRQALYAMRGALGRLAVRAKLSCRMVQPGAAFSAEIELICAQASEQSAVVRAQLYLWDGTEVASRSFVVRRKTPSVRAGEMRALMPFTCTQGAVLRLQCWADGHLAAQNHIYIPSPDARGRAKPFSAAEVVVQRQEGEKALHNISHCTAAGVTVCCGEKELLKFGALLPGERLVLAPDQQIVVQYGNPVKKDGAPYAAQRILRGVFPNNDAADADPQTGDR